jgi:hypothetical protein
MLLIIGYLVLALFMYGLLQVIKLLRQIRILNSMTLKTMIKFCKAKGVDIDIDTIQKEVVENL